MQLRFDFSFKFCIDCAYSSENILSLAQDDVYEV